MEVKFNIEILLKEEADEFEFDKFLRELLKNDKRVDQFTIEETNTN